MEQAVISEERKIEWYALRTRDGECEGYRCGRCGYLSGGKHDTCPSCGARMINPQNAIYPTKAIRV